MIVVNTNVISEAMRERGDDRVVAWLNAQALETLFLTAITAAELRFGVLALPPGRKRDLLHGRLERDVLPLFSNRILAFDLPASERYATVMARARRDGKAIGRADGFIAAIALTHGFSVATRDTSPFDAAGVPVIDPWGRG